MFGVVAFWNEWINISSPEGRAGACRGSISDPVYVSSPLLCCDSIWETLRTLPGCLQREYDSAWSPFLCCLTRKRFFSTGVCSTGGMIKPAIPALPTVLYSNTFFLKSATKEVVLNHSNVMFHVTQKLTA